MSYARGHLRWRCEYGSFPRRKHRHRAGFSGDRKYEDRPARSRSRCGDGKRVRVPGSAGSRRDTKADVVFSESGFSKSVKVFADHKWNPLLLRVAKETLPRSRIRGSSIPLRLHLSTPFLGVLVVHLFHFLGDIGMALHDVFGHVLHSLVPGVGEDFVIARTAELLAGERFHVSPRYLLNLA